MVLSQPSIRQDLQSFLHLCLRTRWDPSAFEQASVVAEQADFDQEGFYQLVLRERVATLVYATWRGKGVLPSAVEKRLKDVYYACAAENAVLFKELEAVLVHLASRRIPVILLKGAALAESVYGNVAVRPMDDLDLLLQQQDVPAALQTLNGLGYAARDPETHDGAALSFKGEVSLIKTNPLTRVEVHWSLNNSAYVRHWVPMDWFWETAVPISVGSASALRLGPEPEVLHLCAHQILNHNKGQLLWLEDVASVISHYGDRLDWRQVLSRARQYRLVIPIRNVLLQVAEKGLAHIPDPVLEQVRAMPVSWMEARLFEWRMAKRRTASLLFFADLASLSSWSKRTQYAWVNLFPSATYMRERYHVSSRLLLPLCYPYRWYLGLSRGWFK